MAAARAWAGSSAAARAWAGSSAAAWELGCGCGLGARLWLRPGLGVRLWLRPLSQTSGSQDVDGLVAFSVGALCRPAGFHKKGKLRACPGL